METLAMQNEMNALRLSMRGLCTSLVPLREMLNEFDLVDVIKGAEWKLINMLLMMDNLRYSLFCCPNRANVEFCGNRRDGQSSNGYWDAMATVSKSDRFRVISLFSYDVWNEYGSHVLVVAGDSASDDRIQNDESLKYGLICYEDVQFIGKEGTGLVPMHLVPTYCR